MKNTDTIENMRKLLPPLFPATQLDTLTQGVINWRTVQNLRSQEKKSGEVKFPEETFVYSGKRKIIINREPLLEWWSSTLI